MPKPGPAAGFEQISHPQKRAVLRSYSQTMRLRQSFEAAKTSLWMHSHWLKTDPDSHAAFAQAREMAAEALEEEAVRRGMGWDEPVYNQAGEQIGLTLKHRVSPVPCPRTCATPRLRGLLPGGKKPSLPSRAPVRELRVRRSM